jgi:hypothetical protein
MLNELEQSSGSKTGDYKWNIWIKLACLRKKQHRLIGQNCSYVCRVLKLIRLVSIQLPDQRAARSVLIHQNMWGVLRVAGDWKIFALTKNLCKTQCTAPPSINWIQGKEYFITWQRLTWYKIPPPPPPNIYKIRIFFSVFPRVRCLTPTPYKSV